MFTLILLWASLMLHETEIQNFWRNIDVQRSHAVASAILLNYLRNHCHPDHCRKNEMRFKTWSGKDIINCSLDDFVSDIVCVLHQAVEFANDLAPEHLGNLCRQLRNYIGRLDNADLCFGDAVLGDYYAGPNHVSPTSRSPGFLAAFVGQLCQKIQLYLLYGGCFKGCKTIL